MTTGRVPRRAGSTCTHTDTGVPFPRHPPLAKLCYVVLSCSASGGAPVYVYAQFRVGTTLAWRVLLLASFSSDGGQDHPPSRGEDPESASGRVGRVASSLGAKRGVWRS